MIILKELSKYELDLVGILEVRWERDGIEPAGKYTFFNGKKNENYCTSPRLGIMMMTVE
jgi:hypothetical protein